MRQRIIGISQQIISEEGIDAFSVRHVASKINYSPSIIYHYFRDKEHLLSCAVRDGYWRIISSAEKPDNNLPPDEKLRVAFKNFVDRAMLVPNEYRAFILNYTPDLQAETSVLGTNPGESSPTLISITRILEEGVAAGIFAPCDVQLTAKVFWGAIFGLFFRLVIEQDISADQRDALIGRQLDILQKGISV
jgi:AcrR family transcriptional regulator